MSKTLIVTLFSMLLCTRAEAREPRAYEMPRTHVHSIEDSDLGRQYEIYVKLPEDYSANPDVAYPAIYTTDAAWHLDLLSGTTEYLMPNAILVGISWQKGLDDEREYISRFRDYTIAEYADPETQAQYQGGGASHHLAFVRDDVITLIESHYRADPDARAYLGYSLGAAFGAYVVLSQPDTFDHYVLGSPAFGPRGLELLDELGASTAPQLPEVHANVLVTLGELEESEFETVERLLAVLRRSRDKDLTVTGLEIIEDSDHGAAPPETFILGVKWLSRLMSE